MSTNSESQLRNYSSPTHGPRQLSNFALDLLKLSQRQNWHSPRLKRSCRGRRWENQSLGEGSCLESPDFSAYMDLLGIFPIRRKEHRRHNKSQKMEKVKGKRESD